MSAPSTLTMITVICDMKRFANWAPSTGKVRIYTDVILQGPTEDLMVTDIGDEKFFDNGETVMQLPATNDPQWNPQNFTYAVEITTGGRVISGSLSLPYDGGPVNLADVLNLAPPTPGANYVLLSARGVPGGVATLDSDGYIPLTQIKNPVLVLGSSDPIPAGTPSGTLIVRTS